MEVAEAHRTIAVVEASQPAAARFLVRELADAAGFGEEDSYRAGLVATELATNLVKHARAGEMLARIVRDGGEPGVEVLSVDRGPGIRDVSLALSDGHSTTGTAGHGLGAVRRLADAFDIHSTEGRGTIVLARLTLRRRGPGRGSVECAGVSVAVDGEPVCGDGWRVKDHPEQASVAVVDGLGHGLRAAEAAAATLRAFTEANGTGAARTLEAMHDAARHTRGAAGTVVDLLPSRGLLVCAGIGNVATSIVSPAGIVRHAVTLPGTLGHQVRGVREFSYPWDAESVVVMHSDGLTSQWTFDGLAGIQRRHPAVMAAALYRDFRRVRDDVTVVVGRMPR